MEITIPYLPEKVVVKNILPEVYDDLISEFTVVDGVVQWDYTYMMADDVKAYEKGLEQEKKLRLLGLIK